LRCAILSQHEVLDPQPLHRPAIRATRHLCAQVTTRSVLTLT
jgi:hypothetical protein